MQNYIEINATALMNLINTQNVCLVDVRNDDEVARGIIPNAVHIQLALLPTMLDKIPKADHIVFYCHSGVRSAHAADFAASKGLKNTYNLSGGVLAWVSAGNHFVDLPNKKPTHKI